MRRFPFLISLLLVAVLAFLLSREVESVDEVSGLEVVSGELGNAGKEREGVATEGVDRDGRSSFERKTKLYQEAWDALPRRRLDRAKRMEMQDEILKAWAEVDPKGALLAFLGESWDDDEFEQRLRGVFREVFLSQPEEIWGLVEGADFGVLKGSLVRDAMIYVLGRESFERALPFVMRLEGTNFATALSTLARLGKPGRKERVRDLEKMWSLIAEDPGRVEGAGQWEHFWRSSGIDLSKEKLIELTRIEGEAGKLAASALALKMMGRSDVDLVEMGKQLGEELRSDFYFRFVTGSQVTAANARTAIDLLIAGEEWDLVGRQEVRQQVREIGRKMDSGELAEWATGLPEREETAGIFHRGVSPYIAEHPEAAWEWLGEFEGGLWRDRGYGEYSQIMLQKFGDRERSQQALDQISDPAFLEVAENWRKTWEAKQR
ncbi:MAG: hypothetical protein ACSHYF_06785 [Verrucomicrobiaceae bacterium]